MLTYIKKDITSVIFGIIAHGVNCSGAMNSGVAGAIRKKWPIVAEQYHDHVGIRNLTLLGSCQLVEITPDMLYVANCFTQLFYGRDGGVYADSAAIRESLNIVYQYASHYELPVYLPRIGCGLGGLSWFDEVEPIVANITKQANIKTFICDFV